jgi:hypothetical protein
MSSAAQYRSHDSLEQSEKDDLETTILKIETTIASIEKKTKIGRNPKTDQGELKVLVDDLLKLVQLWTLKPRPSPLSTNQIDTASRKLVRELVSIIDTITAGDKDGKLIEELSKKIEELSTSMKTKTREARTYYCA